MGGAEKVRVIMQMDYVPRLRHRKSEEGARFRVDQLATMFVVFCLSGLALSYRPVAYSLVLLLVIAAIVFNFERHRRKSRV